MRNRLTLQSMLEELLGSRNVYFRAPTSAMMQYPAIIYRLSDIDNTHANDGVYASQKQYEIIVVDEDPDSPIPDKVNKLPTANFVRPYIADNLNHWVFTITY